MNKAEIKAIHNELDAAIATVLARHNLKTNGSSIRYSDSDFTFKMKVNVIDSDTGLKRVSGVMVSNACWSLTKEGYSVSADRIEELFGKELETPSIGKIKLVDYDTKKRKYPFIVQSSNGNRYKLSPDSFARYAKLERNNY